jgi:hypothetical protein
MDSVLSRVSNGRFFAVLLILLGLAGALRFYELGNPSYWSDEMFQIRDAVGLSKPGYIETRWGMQLAGVDVASIDPEGYGKFRSSGVTEFNGRLAAASLGTLSVVAFAFLLSPVIGRGAALATISLLTICTWHIEWSQSARFYIPMFLYYNTALLAYFIASERRSLPILLLSVVAACLATATKPTSVMLFGVMGIDGIVYWLRTRRLPLDPPGIALLGAGVVCGVLLSLPQGSQTIGVFSARQLGESTLRVVGGNLYHVGPAVALMAAVGAWMARTTATRAVILLVSAVVVPLLAFGTLANFLHVEIRYTFMNVMGWLALAGLGSHSIFNALRQANAPWPVALMPFILVVVASSLSTLHYYEPASGNRPRWRDAYEYVEAHRSPGDHVVGLGTWAGMYYLDDGGVEPLPAHLKSPGDQGRDIWFVVKDPYEQKLSQDAVLHEVFPNRTSYPQDTVRVYFLAAPGRELASVDSR